MTDHRLIRVFISLTFRHMHAECELPVFREGMPP